ncbi:MAG: type II secretion system minor pseudopilin GspK [Rhizobacter sp.]|nr:type II secretion system minor pseudopilin GspK [Rhizobacter sp.]MBP6270156.1 type II secretion system minor pseudopilin GspK [Rhizobacter sp.]
MRSKTFIGRPRRRQAQQGAALLTAMLIVVLVTTLASAMVWQQWRAVQVEAAERARTQAAWILAGALDWARLILREDARSGSATTLNDPWATPLAEARLSSFLAADKAHTDDGPEAFLSGAIADAQSRYNLRNLVDDTGKVIPAEAAGLQRLFESVGVSPDLATRITSGLRGALAPAGSEDRPASPPLMPRTVSQLAWLGVDAASLRRLAPYVVILPVRTPVNLNTAPREVIAASVEGLDVGVAERLVQARKRTPFKTVAEAQAALPDNLTLDTNRVGVLSNFFEVRGRVRLGDRMLEDLSLVERRGLDIVPLQRQRLSLRDTAG